MMDGSLVLALISFTEYDIVSWYVEGQLNVCQPFH